MKRLMISAFAAIALFAAATTMLRSHTPATGRAAGIFGRVMSLQTSAQRPRRQQASDRGFRGSLAGLFKDECNRSRLSKKASARCAIG
jgi:hypothetical protein